ncbi:MAG: efflux RND transporter periplasmic adaptor subunit [Rhizobiales bacterium]|nr:efflux RND transporter periplasmic adaptor subunit [Hyphomicrobiales bacterium]
MKTGRLISGAAAMIAILASIAWLSGWFGSKIEPGIRDAEPRSSTANGTTVTVRRTMQPVVEWASGTVESTHRTSIAARILARVEAIEVNAGDLIATGDVLVRLDSRALEARVQQARQARNAAQARLDLAQVELGRVDDLLKKGVATRQRFDQASSELRVANAEADRLSRVLEEAEAALSYALIVAPASGRVIDRLAEPGDTVAPGQTILRLYDPASLRVEVPVRETLAVNLKLGDPLSIAISAINETTTGTIAEIVPYAEPGARTLLVKIQLPQNQRLFAGMFARVGIPAGTRARLQIPARAVERVGQLEFVHVVDDGRRLVTIGETVDPDSVEVLSGLREDEQLLVTDK